VPFKLRSKSRHHIPRQKHKVTNWREYETGLRNRGSLTIWVTEDVLAAWKAQPRMTPGGQPRYSDLAIETALTLRAVFHLALRQSEGLIGSIMRILGIDLPVPDHTTLSRRTRGLKVMPMPRSATGDLHLIVDSTGLKLRGAGEWLVEKHGTQKRRSWRKLHIGIDAKTGEIVAFDLTDKDIDDGAHVNTLLDQVHPAPALFMGDGAYDSAAVYQAVISRNPTVKVIIPPGRDAVPSSTACTAPTQRDDHVLAIQKHGRSNWQSASGYTRRSKVEAAIGRHKAVIGGALKSRGNAQRNTEIAIATKALNRMCQLGQASFIRVA
jgi:Transposase DDE domain